MIVSRLWRNDCFDIVRRVSRNDCFTFTALLESSYPTRPVFYQKIIVSSFLSETRSTWRTFLLVESCMYIQDTGRVENCVAYWWQGKRVRAHMIAQARSTWNIRWNIRLYKTWLRMCIWIYITAITANCIWSHHVFADSFAAFDVGCFGSLQTLQRFILSNMSLLLIEHPRSKLAESLFKTLERTVFSF